MTIAGVAARRRSSIGVAQFHQPLDVGQDESPEHGFAYCHAFDFAANELGLTLHGFGETQPLAGSLHGLHVADFGFQSIDLAHIAVTDRPSWTARPYWGCAAVAQWQRCGFRLYTQFCFPPDALYTVLRGKDPSPTVQARDENAFLAFASGFFGPGKKRVIFTHGRYKGLPSLANWKERHP